MSLHEETLHTDNAADDSDLDPESPDTGIDLSSITVTGQLRPQATPYLVSTDLDAVAVEGVIFSYFGANKSRFEKQLQHIAQSKGQYPAATSRKAAETIRGFRKGKIPQTAFESVLGRLNMYSEIWEAILKKVVENEVENQDITNGEVLLFQDGDLRGFGTDTYHLRAACYFMPEAFFPLDFDPKDIEATVTARTQEEIEAYVDRRIQAAVKNALVPGEKTGPVEVGDGALVTITAEVNGKRLEEASVKNHMMYTGDVEWESPFRRYTDLFILGRSEGERFELDEIPWTPGVLVKFHIHVHKVFTITRTSPEQLLESRGFASMEVWRETLRAEHAKAEQQQARRAVQVAVESKLREVGQLSPIPAGWLQARVSEQYQNLMMSAGGDEEKLFGMFGVSSLDEVTQILANQLIYDLETALLIRKFAEIAGLTSPKTISEVDSKFLESVWEWAEQNIKIDRLTTDELKARRAAAESA